MTAVKQSDFIGSCTFGSVPNIFLNLLKITTEKDTAEPSVCKKEIFIKAEQLNLYHQEAQQKEKANTPKVVI